jgi:hypothetical protein
MIEQATAAGRRRFFIYKEQGAKGFMLEAIIVLLLVLWFLGLVTNTTVNGLIHLLLLVALIVFVIRVLTGRRAV